MSELTPYQVPDGVHIEPLKGKSNRSDWRVGHAGAIASFDSTDIVSQLRQFFDRMEKEAASRKHDPIAMTHALARLEALQKDVKFILDTVRAHTAVALNEQRIRRLTVEGTATVEASSTADRKDWQDEKLLRRVLGAELGEPDIRWVDAATGESLDIPAVAHVLLTYFRPAWRLTPLREAGFDPDDYSTLDRDEHGKTIRTPTVRMKDNLIRRTS